MWLGFEAPNPYMGTCGATPFLGSSRAQKSKMTNKAQNWKFSAPLIKKWLSYDQKTDALIYMEWLVFLWTFWLINRLNIATFQWGQVYSFSAIKLNILRLFQLNVSLNVDFMATPTPKHKIGHMAVWTFTKLQSLKKFHTIHYSIFSLENLNVASLINFEFQIWHICGAIKCNFQENCVKIAPKLPENCAKVEI